MAKIIGKKTTVSAFDPKALLNQEDDKVWGKAVAAAPNLVEKKDVEPETPAPIEPIAPLIVEPVVSTPARIDIPAAIETITPNVLAPTIPKVELESIKVEPEPPKEVKKTKEVAFVAKTNLKGVQAFKKDSLTKLFENVNKEDGKEVVRIPMESMDNIDDIIITMKKVYGTKVFKGQVVTVAVQLLMSKLYGENE
jgi:hypothetical protein